MPCRNAGPYLEKCLDSILNQSIPDWELLVVNDHSTDDSLPILEKYAGRDKRIHVFQNIKKGIIPALELAFKNSSGDFISRMDADDIMLENKLRSLREVLLKKGNNHVATGLVKYFSDEELQEGFKNYAIWLNSLTRESNNFSDIYKECVIPSPNWMMWREDYSKLNNEVPLHYPEDYNLTFRMYQNGMKVAGVDETTHLWRDHLQRASRTDPNYADQLFHELKVPFFLKNDRAPDKNLVLWGAGKKAKKIAKELNSQNATFRWITNNPDKIGKNIYGVVLEEDHNPGKFPNPQFIIAVSAPDDIKKIFEKMSGHSFKKGVGYFWFC